MTKDIKRTQGKLMICSEGREHHPRCNGCGDKPVVIDHNGAQCKQCLPNRKGNEEND